MNDIIKMLGEILGADEEEIKRDISAGFSIMAAAGIMYGAKKLNELIQKNQLPFKKEDLQPLLGAMQLIADRHRKIKQMSNETPRPKNIELKLPPKPQISNKEEEGK